MFLDKMDTELTRRDFMRALIAGVGALGLGGVSSGDVAARNDNTGERNFSSDRIESIDDYVGKVVRLNRALLKDEFSDGIVRLSCSSPEDTFYFEVHGDNCATCITYDDWRGNKDAYGILNGEIVKRVA